MPELFTLERNGPIVAREMVGCSTAGKFTAVALRHGNGSSASPRSTGLQGFRALASMCDSRRGKLYVGGYAAALVTPCRRVLTYVEARTAFRVIR